MTEAIIVACGHWNGANHWLYWAEVLPQKAGWSMRRAIARLYTPAAQALADLDEARKQMVNPALTVLVVDPVTLSCPYGTMPREAGAGHWREWHRGHGCDKDPDAQRKP